MQFKPEDLKLSEKFKTDLHKALERTTVEAKRLAIKDLFDDFGHVFQTEVDLGGMCVTTSSTTTTKEVCSLPIFPKLSTVVGSTNMSWFCKS
jgi:hypothetical protein